MSKAVDTVVFDLGNVLIAWDPRRLYRQLIDDEQRMEWFREIYKGQPKVESVAYEGLTVNYCRQIGATFILRGIRYVSDFEYEKTIADANRTLDKNIETIFLTGEPKYTSVASTIVRDIIRNGGNASQFLPEVVNKSLLNS